MTHYARVGHIKRSCPMQTCSICAGCGQVEGNFTTEGVALTSIVTADAGAEEFIISAQIMVNVSKGCGKADIVVEATAIVTTGGSQVCPFWGGIVDL